MSSVQFQELMKRMISLEANVTAIAKEQRKLGVMVATFIGAQSEGPGANKG